MDLNNVERNKLDYLLTDLLPTELPELYTCRYFYEFLIEHKSDVENLEKMIIALKNKQGCCLFEGKVWASSPLKYTIMKGLDNERLLSLVHPIAGLQIFLFICTYQKELLYLLDENAVYSLRYHHRNNDLYYKNKNKNIIKYFETESRNSKRDIIEHTGMFFDIKPYNSITSFTTSEEWMILNSKYKYFARTDYKSCFDSIYTHTFTWIIGKSVTDTKYFKNTNIYSAIDRVLMNINSRSSNGLIVGPEFSRMIAELLLQRIDIAVYNRLLNEGLSNGAEYNVYRYVDDIFIFAESEELIDKILNCYSEASRKYLLKLNEKKLIKNKVPFVLEPWLQDTNQLTNKVSSFIFKTEYELKRERDNNGDAYNTESICLFKAKVFKNVKRSLMSQFNNLMCNYCDKTRTIVAYMMGMLINKVSRNKEKYTIFRESVSSKTVFSFIDFVLYIYSFFPDFNNTQRLLVILSYIRDEYDFTSDGNSGKLQSVFNKYAFIFDKANLNDIVNLILFYKQINVEIPYNYELRIVETLKKQDNPLLWATYLIYASYSKKYFEEIKALIEEKVFDNIASIRKWDEAYIYHEFWWILIFNKCPHISAKIQTCIDEAINAIDYKKETESVPGICNSLFIDYLKQSDKQFFEWNLEERDLLREITFKTHQRSVFKNYGSNLNFMNWTSI